MAWLCTLRALLPRPLRNWKLVKATAQLPASASQHSHTRCVCRLMLCRPQIKECRRGSCWWIVGPPGTYGRADNIQGMHWGVLSTSLPRSRHVEVRLSRHCHVEVRGFAPISIFKEFVLFFWMGSLFNLFCYCHNILFLAENRLPLEKRIVSVRERVRRPAARAARPGRR